MLRALPLARWHRAHGARMVPFAGWEMPVQYEGIIKEHRAVRERAGLFDISHMGEIIVRGENAAGFLNYLTANDIGLLEPGKAQYSMFLTERGGVVDDIIVYQTERDTFLVIVNAANTDKVMRYLETHRRPGVDIRNVSDSFALFSLAGPLTFDIASRLFDQPVELAPFRHTMLTFGETRITVAGTGYTGERRSLEFLVPVEHAETFIENLFAAGAGELALCGLGARDSLRIEACLPLYGHELSETMTPFESDLAWVVKRNKGDFIARAALATPEASHPSHRIGYFIVRGTRQIPRQGARVFFDDRAVGEVTSGTFSPLLDAAVCMAFVEVSATHPGRHVVIDVRGNEVRAEAVEKPFLAHAARS